MKTPQRTLRNGFALTVLSAFSLLVILATSIWAADDIRSKVADPSRATFRGLEIDPDVSIYGVPFGGSEDDFIKTHGKPGGYVRLNDAHTALLYGRSHAFVFEDGKLAGVRLGSQILDWRLANELQDWTSFDHRNWRLKGGIFTGMNRKEVRKILGEKLVSGEFGRHHYTSAKARVDLDFSHYTNQGDGDEAYTLHGIYVRHGALAEAAERLPRVRSGNDGKLPSGPERFGGIGAMLRLDNDSGELEIMGVTPGSPAALAELRKGLLIRAIDDVPAQGKGLSESVGMLRGKPGTPVKLEVFDPKEGQSRVVELGRTEIVATADQWLGRLTNLTVTTDQVLRLEANNGARAVIHFLGFKQDGGFGSRDGEEAATYRWRFKPSSSAPIVAGTNTAVNRYTRKLIGPNRFEMTPRNSREEARIKAGDIAVDWSYGYTNKGFIRLDLSTFKTSVHDRDEFEKEP